MLLMDSARHAGYSPVSLDLNVGLPSMPPPRRDMESEADTQPDRPVGGRAAAPMTDEEANKTLLEAKLTEASEENRRLHEMIAYLHANTASPGLPSPAAGCKKRIRRESPDPSNSCDGGNGDRNDPESARLGVIDEASCERIKVIRVCTRINPVDTALAVKDGYQWRKYGQKVTRDNPSPRAYFRCAFAPSCPVKKKVQRSAEDSSVLVATYEGEHNHPSPASAGELRSCATRSGSVPCSISIGAAGPTITLDLTKNGARALDADEAPEPTELNKLCKEIASPEFRTALVKRMASALTSDSNFTGAIAAAILRQLPEY